MKPTHREQPDESRADVARRRLAQLVASFDAELPPPEPERPPPARAARVRDLGWWLLAGRPETSDPVAPLAFSETATPGGAGAGGTPSPSDGAPSAVAPTAGQEVVIDVAGKVRSPGIVTLPLGARVFEAIEAAGGVKGEVDTTALNMARQVTDGEQILVGVDPVAVPAAGQTSGGAAPAPVGAAVNLNTATAEQLDTLPGVGPVTAEAILDWRDTNGRFTTVDDLLDVKGIGEATLAELRDLVVV